MIRSHEGAIPHEVQYGKDQRSSSELREKINEAHANATVETVPFSKIKSPQHSITAEVAEKAVPKSEDLLGVTKEGEPTHGTLEKYKGEYFLRDGNHRTVAAMAAGETEGRFSVIDLDKALGTGAPDVTVPATPLTEQRPYDIPKDIPAEYHSDLRSIAAAVDGSIDELFKEQSLGKVFENAKAAGMTKP